ncbi:35985_t:CDS:2, partial [Gigaspora margarita]
MLEKNIVETVVEEVVQNLRVFQKKQRKHGLCLCYLCRCRGHLVHSCPYVKDQGHDRSLNYKTMDIWHIELEKKDCKGLKYGAKTSYESNRIENRRLTECKEALDATCSTWLQKVEMFRSRICESKSKESLLERKDEVNIKNREIRNDQTRNNNIAQLVEIGIRGDDLDRSESAISLGDDVEPKKLMDSDEKGINESNKKKVIISLITRKEICQTNIQEMKYLPESDKKEMIAKADDTNKEAEKDKDVVDNNVDEKRNKKNVDKNKGELAKGSIDTCSYSNLISIDYANRIGLNWKYQNKEISLGCLDDVAVGNILEVNVVMCGIEYQGNECYYTIESGNRKVTFVNIIEEDRGINVGCNFEDEVIGVLAH